ncbi:hypothetical protein SAMN04488029_0784 [Reichenbachiella faecimaris]|uniref:MORN repeat variant n=1 Tax=Reichenbachiella faecimaris TaxID=692418 RepID=A0A1W2G6Z0_REIFA|nr:DUF6503 family protein [Reichenbachiella faecimaris]SMD32439.1 hypothetical protein SAMN04488029_0784 [Reichenbachiella faecimaris]
MKKALYIFFLPLVLLSACQQSKPSENQKQATVQFQNKGHELIYGMVERTGSYQDLLDKKDVVYTYTYQTPDGKTDVSSEQYIFDGELSMGTYLKHERTLPQLDGAFTQGYNGKEFWLKHQEVYVKNEEFMKRVQFNRKTNFYWFAMFQKLLDPGLNYEHLGKKLIGTKTYDIVTITFNSENGKPTDTYQVYINQETSLVDQFLFTVADFNMMETPLLMQVEYEEIDGLPIPSQRKYKRSTWDAEVSDAPWVIVTWTDIKFNTGLKRSMFDKN